MQYQGRISSSNGSSRNGSTHELPYVRNGWYSGGASPNGARPSPRSSARRPSQPPREFYGGAASAHEAGQLAAAEAASLDYKEATPHAVVTLYEALCDARQLDGALAVIKDCIRASRTDVLAR
jgi:hypothetical protein